jgi:predicted dehydrogenase
LKKKDAIKLAVIGCGFRGFAYSDYTLDNPKEAQVVCACDILPQRLDQFGEHYHVKKEMRFLDAKTMLDSVSEIDLVIVANLDAGHFEVAKMALEKGHHCLLEKPMSPDPWESLELVRIAKENNCQLLVCHVLRYTPLFSTIKQLLEKEEIGRIISIHHAENVSYSHIAHSYVRGNFRNLSPIILAKSCHDLDILNWMAGKKCKKISSFGSLTYFKEENAPAGASKRCMDCSVEEDCPFSACKQYLTDNTNWPTSMISVDTSLEARTKAVKEGDYGRCVFYCDNTVCDHQIVNMLYEDDITVSFNLNGFNAAETREIRILGTKGDIRANLEKNYITIRHFGENMETTIRPKIYAGAHSGGDAMLMKDVVNIVANGNWEDARTNAALSVESHIMAFAAEVSRMEGVIVDIDDFKKEILQKGNVSRL